MHPARRVLAELRVLLSTPQPAARNLAIASHGNPSRAVTDAPRLAEGGIAVVQPQDGGRLRVVARIRKDDRAAPAAAAT